MLIVRLEGPTTTPLEIANPHYEGVGPAIITADGYLVAVQRTGVWECPGKVFTTLRFIGTVSVTFFNPGVEAKVEFGPLSEVEIINSSMWHKTDRQEMIARFDESLGMWHIVAQPSAPMPHCTIRACHHSH
jgi:hypothetical protein